MTKSRMLSARRVAEAGQRLYQQRLRRELEPRYAGKVVVIDVKSGEYFVGDTLREALEQARKKYPEQIFYSVRVGSRAVYSFASGATISASAV